VFDPSEEERMGSLKILNRVAAPDYGGHRILQLERIIADNMIDVANELRLTDVAELILLIKDEHAANIGDLVNSSTELFFKGGTLHYALSASFKAPWDAMPVVRIDLEFHHAPVCAFFRLTIGPRRVRVKIVDILFDEEGLDDQAKSERLLAAFDSARLRPR